MARCPTTSTTNRSATNDSSRRSPTAHQGQSPVTGQRVSSRGDVGAARRKWRGSARIGEELRERRHPGRPRRQRRRRVRRGPALRAAGRARRRPDPHRLGPRRRRLGRGPHPRRALGTTDGHEPIIISTWGYGHHRDHVHSVDPDLVCIMRAVAAEHGVSLTTMGELDRRWGRPGRPGRPHHPARAIPRRRPRPRLLRPATPGTSRAGHTPSPNSGSRRTSTPPPPGATCSATRRSLSTPATSTAASAASRCSAPAAHPAIARWRKHKPRARRRRGRDRLADPRSAYELAPATSDATPPPGRPAPGPQPGPGAGGERYSDAAVFATGGQRCGRRYW